MKNKTWKEIRDRQASAPRSINSFLNRELPETRRLVAEIMKSLTSIRLSTNRSNLTVPNQEKVKRQS